MLKLFPFLKVMVDPPAEPLYSHKTHPQYSLHVIIQSFQHSTQKNLNFPEGFQFSMCFSVIFQILIILMPNIEKVSQISRRRPIVKFNPVPQKSDPAPFAGPTHPNNLAGINALQIFFRFKIL